MDRAASPCRARRDARGRVTLPALPCSGAFTRLATSEVGVALPTLGRPFIECAIAVRSDAGEKLVDRASANSVRRRDLGNRLAFTVSRPRLTSLRGCHATANPAELCRLPALGEHVCDVVGLRPEKQMIGADTQPVIASVTNDHASRQRAVRQFETVAMRRDPWASRAGSEVTVARRANSACPLPAPIRLPHLGPETNQRVSRRERHCQLLAHECHASQGAA